MNHFWKIIILLLTFGLVITGCKKDEKAPEKSEFTDADIETLYREIESQADAILMSDTPDWSALVEKYKDRKEIAAIEANSDGMMVEFVNERVNGWLIPPPPPEIKWDMDEWKNMEKSIQQRSISEKKPKMLYVNAWYHEKVRETEFEMMNYLCSKLKDDYSWDVTTVDEQANVDFFGNGLKGYDVVLIYAHGGIWNNKTWITTSQKVTDPDQYSKGFAFIKIKNKDINETKSHFWAVSHSYISDSYSEKSFENSMIYMACCHGLEKPTHLGDAFANKGKAKVVVGWDETNCLGPYSGYYLLGNMFIYDCSLKDGIDTLKTLTVTFLDGTTQYLNYDNHPNDPLPHIANLVYYGRTGNDIGLNKGGDYKLPTEHPDETVTFTLSDAANITQNSATFDASVTTTATVTDKGICYSQNTTPTTNDTKISKGSGTGTFTATLTNLTANTTYYARPYAIANGNTYYGDVKTFTTLQEDVTVTFTLSDATNITQNSATFDASVTTTATVTDKGICYSQNTTPTTNDTKISKGSGTGTFTATLTDLTANTTYYARPYAIANGNTYYGDAKSFQTASGSGGDEEGVVINGVRWATRNVDMPGTFAANPEDAGMFYQWNRKVGWSSTDPMINSDGGTTWDSSNAPGDTWEKANDPSPAGWRVPTREELESLANTTYVTSVWTTENGVDGRRVTDKATGASLFLPAVGYRGSSSGPIYNVGTNGYYWSSTPRSTNAYFLLFSDGNFYVGSAIRSYGRSVRCVAE